jgi:outer membrane protein insertion porin family
VIGFAPPIRRRTWTLPPALACLALLALVGPAGAQLTTTAPVHLPPAYSGLKGRTIEDVRILGNQRTATGIIQNVIRTRPGTGFDPATVEEDYHSIYGLKKFSNVEAKVEPTTTGVIVTFIVTEQKQITKINFRGNTSIDTPSIQGVVDIREGEAIDSFRIAIARQAIESQYREKNFPYAHVNVDRAVLEKTGELTFDIVEGPEVRIRRIAFIGNHSFTEDRLKDQIQSHSWIWILNPGTFNPDTVDDDAAAIRRYYESKGFFDARVGRRLIFSPDQHEMEVDFVIDEGRRYRIDKVDFRGNAKLAESYLRKDLKLSEGQFYDKDLVERDIRQIVRAYSPLGFIYISPGLGVQSPDYLRVEPQTIFHKEAGRVDLLYVVSEGKPFHLGRVLVKGNTRTQDKVILREMHVTPGQLYNSAEIADAVDRLRGTPYFSSVTVTPIGDDPYFRDVLVEVNETHTALFTIGAGINSNGGVGGNITYEQRNFDIGNPPENWTDVFSERAFIGAGQLFRITLEPGTRQTNASVRFTEPWLFDQPYSLTTEAYYRDRVREHYDETRAGGRVTFGKRFTNIWSTFLTLRGEDVNIHKIEDDEIRAPEILDGEGHHTITSTSLQLRRDTTTHGILPSSGSISTVGWESYETLGGTEIPFQKFTGSWDYYHGLYEDLLDRKTILGLHADAGYIWGTAPFFERFYGGGIGSIRGFRFRGISPRSGVADDPIGGDFSLTGTAEVSFPLAGDVLRGVVFTDAGTVEPDARIGTIRTSVGAGIRLVLPIFGQTPIALDFAFPLTKSGQDDTQIISFSLGFNP